MYMYMYLDVLLGLGLCLSSYNPGGCLSLEIFHPDPQPPDGLPGPQHEECVNHLDQHLPEIPHYGHISLIHTHNNMIFTAIKEHTLYMKKRCHGGALDSGCFEF